MEINKYIKEEIFPDGSREYTGYLEKIIKRKWWLSNIKKVYDLCIYDETFHFECENDDFILGEIYKTNRYIKIWHAMRETNFERETLPEKKSKINIIKL